MRKSDFEKSVKEGFHIKITLDGVDIFIPTDVAKKIGKICMVGLESICSMIERIYGVYAYERYNYGQFIVILDPTQVFLYDIDKQNKESLNES